MNKETEFLDYITIPRKIYNKFEALVASQFTKHNIKSLPIDPFAIAKSEGMIVRPYSLLPEEATIMLTSNEQDGFSYYDPDIEKAIIRYNDSQSFYRQKFTIAHEIGHILLGHRHGSVLAEHMANHFAGYLLAPSPLIHVMNCEDWFDVMDKFEISDECAYYRFISYRNWAKYQIDKAYERRIIKQFRLR